MVFNWRAAAGIPIVAGGGQVPTKRQFRRLRAQGHLGIWIAVQGIHENPHFYKYIWQIWTEEEALPDDYRALSLGPYPWLRTTPELCFSSAMTRMRDLLIWNDPFLVIHHACKRDDPAAPWDIEAVRRNGRNRIAPALADDPDPEFYGHR